MLFEREERCSSAEKASRSTVFYTLFLLISFLGFILEEIFFFLRGHGFADRGFLSSPVCIVYGFGLLTSYFVLGFPERMRLFSCVLPRHNTRRQKILQTILYVFLSGAICTFCELAVGVFMHGAYGILMWDYREIPWHAGPYICLPFALIWGVLAYFLMRFLFLPLLFFLSKVQKKTLTAILLPLTVFLLFDLSMNCTYSFCNRAHMALW